MGEDQAGSRGDDGCGVASSFDEPMGTAAMKMRDLMRLVESDGRAAVPLADTAENEISSAERRGVHIAYMTPDQYTRLARMRRDPAPLPNNLGGNMDRLRADIEANGLKALPWLSIRDGEIVGQEGLHRAAVLKDMGFAQIPVRIFAQIGEDYLDQEGAKQAYRTLISRVLGEVRNNLVEADRSVGTHDADAARKIGDCTIEAIARVTGLPWKTVWEAAKPHFGRTGMHGGGISATLRTLGWQMEGYSKMPWFHGMTVKRAEEWLRANDPDVVLICTIMLGGIPHAISYKNGRFDNVQGAYKAKLRLVDRVMPLAAVSEVTEAVEINFIDPAAKFADQKKAYRFKKVGQIGEFVIYRTAIPDDDVWELFVMDDKRPVATVFLNKWNGDEGPNGWQVRYAATTPSHRGQGIIRRLYTWLMDRHKVTLISDESRSVDGNALWKWLERQPGFALTAIHVLPEKAEAGEQMVTPDVWADEGAWMFVARKRP